MKGFCLSISVVVLLSALAEIIHSYRGTVRSIVKRAQTSEIFSSRSRTDAKKSDGQWQGGSKTPKLGPLRNGEQINYVAEWQAKGDHYVGYDNLLKLENMMTSPTSKSKSDKSSLLSELSLTYFAR